MQDTNALLKRYLKDIRGYPILSKEKESELLLKASKGDRKSGEMIINSCLRFAVTTAFHFTDKNRSYIMDLISECNLGLSEALKDFNPEYIGKIKFITFAIHKMKKNCITFLERKNKTIKRPFENYYTKDIIKHKALNANHARIDFTIDINDPNSKLDFSNSESTFLLDKTLLDYTHLQSKFKLLNQDHQTILSLYFGLGDIKPLKNREIGDIMGYSKQRVDQIKKEALKILKKKVKLLEPV